MSQRIPANMTTTFATPQDANSSRTGLTSLAAETRQIVDQHQEVQARTTRKFMLFVLGLVIAAALVLLLLSATTAFA
jgi:hypothetical protein